MEAGRGWQRRRQNVVVSSGSETVRAQAPYVSALNVNGLTLATHTARRRNSR